jgi:DNA invertase Pin-like site-specific DNA recombinase
MKAVIYSRVSSESQDYQRQINNLKEIAEQKGWILNRTFAEKVTGLSEANQRNEFRKLMEYIKSNNINVVMVSEVSRLGRRVLDILQTVEILHRQGVAIFIQQFNMISIDNGKENPMVMMLLQMLSIGAQLEHSQRAERQKQGIQIAKLQGKYHGRKRNSNANREKTLLKYSDIADMIKKSELSARRIARITDHSINTVRMVKALIKP